MYIYIYDDFCMPVMDIPFQTDGTKQALVEALSCQKE